MTGTTLKPDVQVQGPAWDLSDEYPAVTAGEVDADLQALDDLLDRIAAINPRLSAHGETLETLAVADAGDTISSACEVFTLAEQSNRLLGNLSVFASCLLSVDAEDDEAQVLQGRLLGYRKRVAELLQPSQQFLDRASDAVVDAYLDNPTVSASAFSVRHDRQRRHERLTLAEENLIAGLSQDAIHAWGRLYTQLSGTLNCEVMVGNEVQILGIAQASGLMQKPDQRLRHAAWQGINAAWETHQETCAAAINAIAGWRLETVDKRSARQAVHFLDAPLHVNKIRRATLDTLLAVCEASAPVARRAALAMARAGGREKLGPWDLRAPAPQFSSSGEAMPFDEALRLIAEAYAQVHPEMGDFVNMVAERRWIEGTVTHRKRPGAYCTRFPKSRNPRVYMTYTGSSSDVITLAHELGHAFHSWVMRDLPECQRSYGMSLAETASTFGETTVRDALLTRAPDAASRFDIMWEEMAALPTFMLNIPARFSFEKTFYERRAERPLRPNELKEMMAQAWNEWYADSMSEPDPMFWASKLHFYISGLSFYNFPYLFGYLFSTGVYLKRDDFEGDFYSSYVALLRDTGRMTAEQLASEHLQVSLDKPAFWEETIASLESRVARFEAVVAEITEG
ncbi:MAG: M3 family oligoendopeptidase [Gammaproteobacteria bacterium]|nr:M3 family oligoendopeptidase [Gammaproteobacteria bacterium]